jgi:hypothetical protein
VFLLWLALGCVAARAERRQELKGHLRAGWTAMKPVGSVVATQRMQVAVSLPLRDREGLTNLLAELYDPRHPRFGRHLSTAEFTERFGPSRKDYQQAIDFARRSGLRIVETHPNRTLLSMEGTADGVEQAFHLKLVTRAHPTDSRTFFAPDREPTVGMDARVLHVSGLNNYHLPHPSGLRRGVSPHGLVASAAPATGSGPNGEYMGFDFRRAYVPGSDLTGAGQSVGLFELGGYYATDIAAYEAQTGVSNVPLKNVLVDGYNGAGGSRRPGSPNEEVALDIEMAISIAPGLASVLVYEGPLNGTTSTVNDILNRMATDNLARQLSCSWGFDIDEATEQVFLQYAAQGQSFFEASGDNGAFVGPVEQPSDSPLITVVGGTVLSLDSAQGWISEAAWSHGGGGVSTIYPLPPWQQGLDLTAAGGSSSMRNVPDVAMVAANIRVYADRGQVMTLGGTSVAAPLWAGFAALANERATRLGKPSLGFLNPALYRIGRGAGGTKAFHDIDAGSNAQAAGGGLFSAVPGYDLCTGWGSPNGTNLITALVEVAPSGLGVAPAFGFLATRTAGGVMVGGRAEFILTNAGSTTLSWTATPEAGWLVVSPNHGSLAPGEGGARVTAGVGGSVTNLLIGTLTADVRFDDLSQGRSEVRTCTVSLGNGGFESGDLTDWTLTGLDTSNFADSIDLTKLAGTSLIPGVDDSAFVHAGRYGAFLGQPNNLSTIVQTLRTVPGRRYRVSCWVANPAAGTPNEFRIRWGGQPLFDAPNLPLLEWTNLIFTATASTATTALEFASRNDPNAFALDDIAVVEEAGPTLQPVFTSSAAGVALRWASLPGVPYQVQFTENASSGAWVDLGPPVMGTGGGLSTSDVPPAGASSRYYRIVLLE